MSNNKNKEKEADKVETQPPVETKSQDVVEVTEQQLGANKDLKAKLTLMLLEPHIKEQMHKPDDERKHAKLVAAAQKAADQAEVIAKVIAEVI